MLEELLGGLLEERRSGMDEVASSTERLMWITEGRWD
jgi:hypothetical protein